MTKKLKNRRGLSTIELMVASVLLIVAVFSIAVVLSDSQRGWDSMYNRIYSDVVTDSHVARRMFDAVVRKSSSQGFSLDSSGNWVEVCYYASDSSASLDRYARFLVAGTSLYVEYGSLNPRQTLNIETVCGNVSSCVFKKSGRSVQMMLTLNNSSEELTTVTSAVMHN